MTTVSVDYTRCGNAIHCRRCLDLCPVFMVYPAGPPFDVKSLWRVKPTLISLCSGCRKCEESCPAGALNVKVKGRIQ